MMGTEIALDACTTQAIRPICIDLFIGFGKSYVLIFRLINPNVIDLGLYACQFSSTFAGSIFPFPPEGPTRKAKP